MIAGRHFPEFRFVFARIVSFSFFVLLACGKRLPFTNQYPRNSKASSFALTIRVLVGLSVSPAAAVYSSPIFAAA
jgi:hypothetical protein